MGPRWRISARAWPYAFVVLAPLLLLAPFLAGRQVMYWGTPMLQFYPWREFALETLRGGHLPLWNPYLGNGAPLIANYQSAIFYPPNWLYLVIPPDFAMGWLVAVHLVWAGAGMVSLTRTLGLRPLGQVVAGLAFGMSQYMVARAGFLSINAAAAWLPWLIWLAEHILNPEPALSTPQPASPPYAWVKHFLLLSLFLSFLLLAGHAQTAWYTLLLVGAWTLWRLVTRAAGRPRQGQASRLIVRRAAVVALSIPLAVMLASIQLLPTAELLRQSPRAAAADYDFVMTYSFSPWRLLTLLAPDLLGNPARGEYFGYGNYWEDAIYAGVLPLLLAGGALARAVRDRIARPAARPSAAAPTSVAGAPALPLFLLAILAVAVILALGRNTPAFPFFYRWVPTFNLFQAPARMMLWFVFALALLAGLGAEGGRAPKGRALYWTRLGAAGAVAMVLTGAAAQYAIPPGGALALHLHTIARALALAGGGLFISAVLSLLKPSDEACAEASRNRPGAWQIGVAIFVAGDLIFAGHGLNPGAAPDLYRTRTATAERIAPALAEGQRLFYFPDDEYHIKFDQLLSFDSFGPAEWARAMREAQAPNVAMVDGLASANNFEPLVSARYAGVLDVISQTRSLSLLRMMNVGVVAAQAGMGWDLIAEEAVSGAKFYRVPGEVRRWWVVYAAQSVPDAESARRAIAAADFDPRHSVVLEADDPGMMARSPVQGAASLTASGTAVTIAASLDRPGWLVLADTYYPGWVAYVDGSPAALRRANYAFRAVAVEQGDHRVEFRYEPRSFDVGLRLTGLGGLVWLGLAGAWLVARRRRP